MTDKVHLEHYCTCGRWGSFGNRNAKGITVWTCGPDECRRNDSSGQEHIRNTSENYAPSTRNIQGTAASGQHISAKEEGRAA